MADIPEPEEQARISAILLVKAREFGIEKEYSSVLKAYAKAQRKLENEYTRQSASQNDGIALDYDAKGMPIPSIDNFLQILRNDPKFTGLQFNLLTNAPEQKGVKWTDSDDSETRRYIEKRYRIHSKEKCDDAMRIVFEENQYHPIRQLIDSLQWDGEERCRNFLHFATRCDDTAYTREVSRLIFAGGINRLYRPGCKFDDMPVLIGTRQGEGKSTLIRWLAMRDEWFTEVDEFDGQQGIEALEGAWICEVGELLALTKAREQESAKAYLTRQNDRYRMPYDHRVSDHPRQCIFLGTTNKEQFLMDKTGNRRFYPIKVKQNGYELFDREDEIRAYIEQCWAEAKAKLGTDEMQPYADRDLIESIREKQYEATEDDWRVGMIEAYLRDKDSVCILELWKEALQNDFSKPSKKDSNEIGLIMQTMPGWEKQPKVKWFTSYGTQKWWSKKTESEGENVPLLVD